MSGIPAGAGSLLGKRLGKFEILALLALGGTAEIYLARIAGAAGFEKYVVVKCLHDHLADDPEFVRMFLDEARLAAHLDHSNIVQTMELGEHENRYYMVMEYLAGLSLAMIVRRAGERIPGGRIPVPLVLNMVSQACAGLHYAHEKAMNGKALGIVHRDISPQNLVVSFEGVVKVVDFGIAKAELRETKTRSGTIKGKFAYMSPEQCIATNVDRRTDVFALGTIAHELLTGRRLFKRNTPYETYQAVIDCVVEPPSKVNHELDPAVDEIIMRAVTREQDQRYPTAEAFGDALQRYLHSRGKGSGPGEVSRFFDATFGQEIEEYGARMRELIEGREAVAADAGVTWGAEEDEARRLEVLEVERRASSGGPDVRRSNDPLDPLASARPNRSSLPEALGNLDDDPDDEGDLPADRTRIETNPVDHSSLALDETALARPAREDPNDPVSRQMPAQPPITGALPLPPAPASARSALARSSDFAIPSLPAPAGRLAPTPIELSPTELGTTMIDSRIAAEQAQGGHPQIPRPSVPLGPTSYPVMSSEMSAQMMSGNVYPSERPSRSSQSPLDSLPRQSGPIAAQTPHGQQQAADVVSPVGDGYPQRDWAESAAIPARAFPLWMLGILFVVTIGLALALTIVIAKVAR